MATTPLPDLKTLVSGSNRVRFLHYRKGELWYGVEKEGDRYGVSYERQWRRLFEFPVPISDCGDATFLAQDKALLFMRYIRKHLAALKEEMEGPSAGAGPSYAGGAPVGEADAALGEAQNGVAASQRAADLRRRGYKA